MKRKDENLFEDLAGIAALLPWWVGTALAIACFIVLHLMSTAESPTTTSVGQFGQMFTSQLIKSFAFWLQFLIPSAFLAGSAVSFFRQRSGRWH